MCVCSVYERQRECLCMWLCVCVSWFVQVGVSERLFVCL